MMESTEENAEMIESWQESAQIARSVEAMQNSEEKEMESDEEILADTEDTLQVYKRIEELKEMCREGKILSKEYRHHLRKDLLGVLAKERNFKVVDYLGGGSYGEVMAVDIPKYKSTVAVKFVAEEDGWVGELALWPTLHHDNVLNLLEIIKMPFADLFVTPLMYRDMETVLEAEAFINNPSCLVLAKRWLAEILKALHYLHSRRMCHLDIKGDNVLINYDSRAVLCDFTFINHSVKLVRRYGVPIPYRPPETCLSSEKTVGVDAIPFEVWSYGILALNVLTNHYLKGQLDRDIQYWHRDIYPLLYEAMNICQFRRLMEAAFQGANTEEDFTPAFDFVQFILRYNPEDRPTVVEISRHIFLDGKNTLKRPDDIWLVRDTSVWTCFCISPPLPKLKKKIQDFFHSFKIRRSHKKSWQLSNSQKGRKWSKSLNDTRTDGAVTIGEDAFVRRTSKDYESPEVSVKETNFELDTVFKDNNISLNGCTHRNFPGLQTDHESFKTAGATRDEAGFNPDFVYRDKVQESSRNRKQQEKSSGNREMNDTPKIVLKGAEEMLTEHENETEIIQTDGVRPDNNRDVQEGERRRRGVCGWLRERANVLYVRIVKPNVPDNNAS